MSESSRDDNRYVEDASVAFCIYCDTNGLTREDGWALAERLGESLAFTAEDREGA